MHEDKNRIKPEQEIGELIKKDAHIYRAEKEIQATKKEISNIEKSSTWKAAKPLRKITGRPSAEKAMQNENRMLREELEAVKDELYSSREALQSILLNDRQLNSAQLIQAIRDHAEEGTLLDYLEKAVRQRKQHDANYREALRYGARLFMKEKTDYRQLVYSKVLEALHIEEIPEFLIREGLAEEPLPLKQAASYRASLNMRFRQQQLAGELPELVLDNKKAAYQFMEKLGIRIPCTSKANYKYKDIPKDTEIVIKPADGAGSRGVYLVHDFNDIIDVKRQAQLDSWEAMEQSMKNDLDSGWVAKDEWYTEELILEDVQTKTPASDVKFYCFYGKVGLVLEITRYPELKYCWWTAEGERVHTGKYEDEPFLGKGVTQAEVDMAAKISAEIPVPFIRIDFLRGEGGLVFGEFTPKPGNYDEFDEATDQQMGDYFLEAEGRLVADLLEEKRFTVYRGLTNNTERPAF